jgi:biopolymer transport protein ExbB
MMIKENCSLGTALTSSGKYEIYGAYNLIDLIIKGGVAMYPIILCSVFVLAIVIERLWVLRRRRVIPGDFIQNLEDLISKKKISEALFMCQGNHSSIARVIFAGLKNAGKGLWLIKEAIEERGSREAVILEKRVGILSTIATLGPLLGLFGTVSGVIKSFNAISIHGSNDPMLLAGGIAEALVATASGLAVAIPALICHRFLKDKANALIFEMEEYSIKIVELLSTYTLTD